jgi:hypothetical protein
VRFASHNPRAILEVVGGILKLIDHPDLIEIEVGGTSESCVVLAELAEDENGDIVVSVLCRGNAGFEADLQFMELGFEVIFTDGAEVVATQNREIVRHHVPNDIRRAILPIVCRCYTAILDAFQPGFVYRACAYPTLPEEAMAKHDLLTKHVISCGYYLYRGGTDDYGYTFWLCAKAD